MTDDEVHDAIMSDPTAKALAEAGKDADVVGRLSEILPPKIREGTYVYDRGILAAFPDPADGEAFIAGLGVAAQNNPVLARVLKWLSPSEGGIDVGNHVVRAQLDYLTTLNIPGITSNVVGVLKALAEGPQDVSSDQVSRAMARYRPDGRIT